MRTVFRTTGRYGGHRSLHTERDCPLLNKGKNIISTEVETIDDEDLCSYCAGDEDWNQGEDDLSYQRALKQADPETPVTDGGMVTVCPECRNTQIYRLNPDHPSSPGNSADKWYCATCQDTFDEPSEREPRAEPDLRGLAGALDEADPEEVGKDSKLAGGQR